MDWETLAVQFLLILNADNIELLVDGLCFFVKQLPGPYLIIQVLEKDSKNKKKIVRVYGTSLLSSDIFKRVKLQSWQVWFASTPAFIAHNKIITFYGIAEPVSTNSSAYRGEGE